MEKMKSDYEYQIKVMTNRIKQLQDDLSVSIYIYVYICLDKKTELLKKKRNATNRKI